MEFDAATGSRLTDSPFDLTGDKKFTDADKVDYTSGGTTTKVPVSGLKSTEGILARATVLPSDGVEIKYNSGSTGGIFVTVENVGTETGRTAWRQRQ